MLPASAKVLLFLCGVTASIALSAATRTDDESDQSASLMSFLKHFNQNRHHVINLTGKKKARDFIKKTFQELNLTTWSEEFKPDFSQNASGVNIIGMLPGTFAGSPNDRLFLIGSHYDTVRTTSHGANDNGSGMVAMLQVAKQIATDFKTCARSFSILFVAFDFEEWENCTNTMLNPRCACGKIDCGSRAFVANLTRFYNGSLNSNGKLQGAIIMDTVMNYNDTPNSQILPPITKKLLPEVYGQIKADEFRGNFLSVVGRQFDDAALMNSFWFHYNRVKSDLKNKTTMYSVNLPFSGQPENLPPAMADFLRSDHVPFWNSSLSAIFLSDTADHRSYMTKCYHENCDSVARVTPEMLQFLQKTSDVILAVTNDVTMVSCPPVNKPEEVTHLTHNVVEGMEDWRVALLSIGMFLLGMPITVIASACYRRWKKEDTSLVNADQLQSSSNTDVTKV